MKMPWGKFKGQEMDVIPSPYLRWIAENWPEDTARNRAVCLAADAEWQYREKNDCHFTD